MICVHPDLMSHRQHSVTIPREDFWFTGHLFGPADGSNKFTVGEVRKRRHQFEIIVGQRVIRQRKHFLRLDWHQCRQHLYVCITISQPNSWSINQSIDESMNELIDRFDQQSSSSQQ